MKKTTKKCERKKKNYLNKKDIKNKIQTERKAKRKRKFIVTWIVIVIDFLMIFTISKFLLS